MGDVTLPNGCLRRLGEGRARGGTRARRALVVGLAGLALSACWGRTARSSSGAAAGGWTIEVTNDSTASIRYRNTEMASFSYQFWGRDWAWTGVETKSLGVRGDTRQFQVRVPDLGVTLAGTVRAGKGELAFEYAIDAAKPIEGVVGGGLEFSLKLPAAELAGLSSDVDLLPDQQGFTWQVGRDQELSARLDQSIPSVEFERGHKETIRFYLFSGRIAAGRTTRTLTIRLPAGGTVRQSLADRYGDDAGADWVPNALVWDKWPIDVSFLGDGDRPAGKHGRVRARGDHLEFEDGTPARFWGTNIAAYTLFGNDHAKVALQAKRLAALGYNLVRIHHHDSDWVSPNIIAAGDTTGALNGAALDDIDWWVKCLREEGIYVWLDMKVGRTFRAGDGIPGFDELTRSEKTGRGFDYVNPRLEELERDLAVRYLSHVNRYTGKSFAEDPTVIAALLLNEDDITAHFGNGMLPKSGNAVHERLMRAAVERSAAALGVSTSGAMRLWQAGPAKMALSDIQASLYGRHTAALRKIGFAGLVAGTSYWGDEPISSLPSLASADVVDVHSYGAAEALSANPRFEANFIDWIGGAQVATKPLTVSEWNVQMPARDRFTAPLYVAAIAALQGWDAPMIFAYLQDGLGEAPSRAGDWSTGYDPALTALMPAAAVAFRGQHIAPARTTYRFAPGRDLYDRDITPANSSTIRTLVEQSRLVLVPPDLPGVSWDDGIAATNAAGSGKAGAAGEGGGSGAIEVTTPDRDFIPAGQNKVRSDTGEIERDWLAGTQTIDTPRTQAASGWIGGRHIKLRDTDIEVGVPKATVALTSLDGQPIVSSRKLLLTVVGQVTLPAKHELPYRSQPVSGTVALRSTVRDLMMTPLAPDGTELKPAAAVRRGDRATFTFPPRGTTFTHWYLIAPRRPKS